MKGISAKKVSIAKRAISRSRRFAG